LSNICLQSTNTPISQGVTETSRTSALKYYSVEIKTALTKFFLVKPGFPSLILIRQHIKFPSNRFSLPNVPFRWLYTLEESSRTIRN